MAQPILKKEWAERGVSGSFTCFAAGMRVIQQAENGLVVNASGEVVMDDFPIVTAEEVNNINMEDEKQVRLPVLKESHRIEGYLVTMDCKVTSDHHYFSDGINEFLIVLAEEDGEMRIVQFPSAKELSEQ